jgi:hypothetical protein
MATYRIVCVTTRHPHRHIVEVGTGIDPDSPSRRWTVEEVRAAMADGDEFYTESRTTMRRAAVRADDCPFEDCTVKTLRSAADAVVDNNLESLQTCSWT